jgi:HK97 family phage major capsid protein
MGVRDKDRAAFKDALDEARSIIDGAKADDRDLTADEKDEVDGLVSAAEAAKARIETDTKDDTLALRLSALMGQDAKSDEPDPTKGMSAGEVFANSPAFKAWLAEHVVDGALPDSLKNFRTPAVHMGSKFINTAALADAFPSEDRRGVLAPHPWPRGAAELLALLSTGTTGSSLIHYAEEAWTNNADFVAEATATAGTSGTKPESEVVYTPKTVPVSTIAHWVAATKWALADFGQLRALIDNGLRRGILQKIADAILNGAGVDPEWFGFNELATIPPQAFVTSPLLSVKAGLGALETAGYDANGIVMNPADWQAIDDATPVVITDPLNNRPKRIGGVAVVTLAQQPAGSALVGDFKQAYLLDREQSTITATDSHADFFIRNMVAILGEYRGAFFVPVPAAFRKVDLTSGA